MRVAVLQRLEYNSDIWGDQMTPHVMMPGNMEFRALGNVNISSQTSFVQGYGLWSFGEYFCVSFE